MASSTALKAAVETSARIHQMKLQALREIGPWRRNIITITQIRSGIGQRPQVRKNLEALGLGKLHTAISLPDSPQLRGQIKIVLYFVSYSLAQKCDQS